MKRNERIIDEMRFRIARRKAKRPALNHFAIFGIALIVVIVAAAIFGLLIGVIAGVAVFFGLRIYLWRKSRHIVEAMDRQRKTDRHLED